MPSNTPVPSTTDSGPAPLYRSALPLPLVHAGKVREVYAAGPTAYLMVASDRVSAFDVVMEQPVPRKGEILNLITAWWATQVDDLTPHHILAVDPREIRARIPELEGVDPATWERRSMLVRQTRPLPVECVVRGYLAGSAWREYRDRGTLAGEPLSPGLLESDRLDPPLFSPATKAQEGHDENITFAEAVDVLGAELADQVRAVSQALYARGRQRAGERGIILADTKFEFGIDDAGELILIDEVLTPDSSRYWPAEQYGVGRGQESLDKQPIRDFLDGLPDWDKSPPPPRLPQSVLDAATRRYMAVFTRLTGFGLDEFAAPSFGGDV